MILSFASLLFVPGGRLDRIEKARAAGAGLLCVDLEDSVPVDGKAEARKELIDRLDGSLAVRINSPATPHGIADLALIAERKPSLAALLLPMCESARELDIVGAAIGEPVPVIALIESVAGLAAASDIARHPRCTALMFGGGDLSRQLGVALEWEPLLHARGQLLLAAAGAGKPAIDVPYIRLDDGDGLAEECRRARALGFAAKAAIHPAQVATIERAFAPSEAEIATARAAIDMWQSSGGRPVRFNGEMLEAPLVERFERILARQGAANA